ncbi:P-loop containing nucleoside triphosphate hydrolase protein [Chytridium lagenaria]|nr:P-loop containing nucleoside triphosphate hydrolase protein [Chytridium lagenaria]
MNYEESEITHCSRSMFVQGRSGTGKTSCIVHRMLLRYITFIGRGFPPSATSLRQVFITSSPGFCSFVKKHFSELCHSLRSLPEDERIALALRSLDSDDFVMPTSHHITPPTEEQPGLRFDFAERSLPDSLTDLTSAHFPLFVSFKKFLSMAANAYLGKGKGSSISYADIEFRRFRNLFKKANKGLNFDDHLSFNEIMGIIKGSNDAAFSANGYLTCESYMALSERKHRCFVGLREELYGAFKAYQEKKGKTQDFLDIVNSVIRAISKADFVGKPFDEIYIDEVQDLTMSELRLLMSLCCSPFEGLLFAGDTAQTIAPGSAFRFQELGSLTYQLFKGKMQKGTYTETMHPKTFSLRKNYRSHDGILRLAAEVLNIIHQVFPEAVDRMPADIGQIDGPLPVWVRDTKPDVVLNELSKKEGFGPETVILVRTVDDRERINKDVGTTALVMTVGEVKGMEFNNVILHSFFTGPDTERIWESFAKCVRKDSLAPAEQIFGLLLELRIFYTAITRARQRLWILEEVHDSRRMSPRGAFYLG